MDFFIFFIKSDGVFNWNGLSICVFSNTMNNSVQLKDWKLWLFVLLVLIILELRSSAALECAACICFLRKLSLKKNPLKICKTVRNEKATMRPWERQWKHVTHYETMRVEWSAEGSTQYSLMNNHILLNSSIKDIENSKHFSGSLC